MNAAIRYIEDNPQFRCEITHITPESALRFLECNASNRPLRRKQVDYLRSEIRGGHWKLNGEPIIISDTGEVLDGQHRLAAIAQESVTVTTLVVYGVSRDVFHTIDTGASRTKADAMYFSRSQLPHRVIDYASSAVLWCRRLEQNSITALWKLSNQEATAYIDAHPSIIENAEILVKYPRENRPISGGPAVALLEMFSRKDRAQALQFMHLLMTGEELVRTDVQWQLRQALIQSSTRIARLTTQARMRMTIKGWNWVRRGNGRASPMSIAITKRDTNEIIIL